MDEAFNVTGELALEMRGGVCVFVNADIALLPWFARHVERVLDVLLHARYGGERPFLLVGRRVEVASAAVAERMSARENAIGNVFADGIAKPGTKGVQEWGQDLFVYSPGLWGPDMPPFLSGLPAWDNWALGDAARRGAAVVDITAGGGVAIHLMHTQRPGNRGQWAERQRTLAKKTTHKNLGIGAFSVAPGWSVCPCHTDGCLCGLSIEEFGRPDDWCLRRLCSRRGTSYGESNGTCPSLVAGKCATNVSEAWEFPT
jgi:hypothetical protein